MLYNNDFLTQLEASVRLALPAWNISPNASLSLLTISENATYLVEDTSAGRRVILRVHRPAYHSDAEIRSELAWIEALCASRIIVTPQPIRATNGALLVSFSDGDTRRNAVAFTHMTGQEPDTSTDLVKWYGHLGEITARLHSHSRAWQRPADFRRKVWEYETIIGKTAYWGDWRQAPGLTPEGKAILERTATLLASQTTAYGQGDNCFGLIHCDMRAANLLVEGDRLGVIDFDDCGLSWYAYDFAASISFMEHQPFIPDLTAAWLNGYRRVAPLAAEHENALPMFVMLRRMQLSAWIASHAETPTAQSMGEAYTRGTVALADQYLSRHSTGNAP